MRTSELPQDVVEALKEAEYSIEEIENFGPNELMNKWLDWEGIIGYTIPIMKLAKIIVLREALDGAIEEAE